MIVGAQEQPGTTERQIHYGLPVLCILSLLSCCVGCLHPRPSAQNGFRLEENGGYSFLVPALRSTRTDGDFQTSLLVLGGNEQRLHESGMRLCVVEGSVFSLHPVSTRDVNQWLIRSWSLEGWNRLGGSVDVDDEWRLFLHDLDLLNQQGCFGPGSSVFSIQDSIARLIPLPASEPGLFLYTEDAEGFVDLAPAMEIKIEEVNFPEHVADHDPSTILPSNSLYAYYQVDLSQGGGVHLRRSSAGNSPEDRAGRESDLYPGLAEKTAATSLIRLFFEKISDTGVTRAAMLLGATNVDDLNAASKRIQSLGTAACTTPTPGIACMLFKNDSVSLLSSVQVNGKLKYYPLGTRLGTIFDQLLQTEQAQALASARVRRRFNRADYADVLFLRTMESARQIVLLPGDKIHWR